MLTDEAHLAIIRVLGLKNETSGRRLPGGWEVDIEDGTLKRLEGMKTSGESLSDCVIRLATKDGLKLMKRGLG
jgi:hypothetical protein